MMLFIHLIVKRGEFGLYTTPFWPTALLPYAVYVQQDMQCLSLRYNTVLGIDDRDCTSVGGVV